MPVPQLSPASTVSTSVLTSTGSAAKVAAALPFTVYSTVDAFLSGASDQVAYVYKKLGGDILDIEIKAENVYAAYQEAVLEYSYVINSHQAKNVLSDMLGATTASFDEDGEISSGAADASRDFPNFGFGYARRVAGGISTEAGVGGFQTQYSASFTLEANKQKYDLQAIVQNSSSAASSPYYNKINNKKILIRDVFYKSPKAMWRFFGYYGGLNVVGNLNTYGMFADNSTFEVIPTWQNRLQAMAYEDSVNVRFSQYSYNIQNNFLLVYPPPGASIDTSNDIIWFTFTVEEDANAVDTTRLRGVKGVNNMNTLPFANIPYDNINSVGKQWIRRYALALCKEILGQVRSKFSTIPIPNDSVTLNGDALITQARDEQEKLKTELKELLESLTYGALADGDSAIVDATSKVFQQVPNPIFVG
jgi:hypothetical protein